MVFPAELESLFQDKSLVRPDASVLSFVDLVNVIASAAGAAPPNPSEDGESLLRQVGSCEHLVYVLVDGLGSSQLKRLPDDAFLRRYVKRTLRSVYPSATASALPTLATGLWPGQHGVPGWWAYLPDRELEVTTLPYVNRRSGAALEKLPLMPSAMWPEMPLAVDFQMDPLFLSPEAIVGSTFSQYLRGYRTGRRYSDFADALQQTIERIEKAEAPTFTCIYYPDYDTACHHNTADSAVSDALLTSINDACAGLHEKLVTKARIMIGSDHGHLAIAAADHHLITMDDEIGQHLHVPPVGEPRAPVFFVNNGEEDAFAEAFNARFAGIFTLIAAEDLEETQLLGPVALTPHAQNMFGDFIAVALKPAVIVCDAYGDPGRLASYHGGLTPEEVLTPLILA